MDTRQIDARIWVAGQLGPADMEQAAQAGFTLLVCNRPDNEHGPGQPEFAAVAAAAEAAGITARHIPFGGEGPHPGQPEELARLLAGHEGKVLLYCRSGARSASLYNLARALA
ncbi:MAG: TIGR01244 family phosphatase [Rubellimicrobium sp.]|nr:TIGR01244 family phosphatase [Rubellimicrobium sp.]